MPANNDVNKPTNEEVAESVSRLAEHVEQIQDPALRAFVERIMGRVEAMKQEAQIMIVKSDGNECKRN